MMGRTHALTGWCAGLAVAPLVGAGQIHEAVAMATTTAGFALLPDLDHPGARASRLLGPLTGGLSWLLRRASAGLYALTRREADDNSTGTHRHMTHTLAFAGALGAATTIGTQAGGIYAVAAVAILGLLLAENALGDWLLPAAGAAIAWWAYTSPSGLSELTQLSGWLGIAVALGCVVHCLGDAITESGCPFLWPIPIRGETWYELRPPAWLRFHTGKTVENALIAPAATILAIALLPGITDLITPAINSLQAML
ncbi:metal-dependent hydrolase [Haloechinothrix sp. YIM 98757]|uniref:Metal-dependent hydrolase n=1 Tax=Haloechinothrix aidingensis TaxID=2752311 RepID=A0A838A5L7_9PSEU|nr:metal-dependent hydrolase [Haloechinothrix aidingensis]MBA0124298.1 metal-dependent hydrolase [Haloechinothrix aidingensis]